MSADTTTPDTGRKLTGWHVLAIFVGGFGIIFAVNFFMAYSAVSTFPGMEVSSSYADSQTFDERRDAQEALGWNASVQIPGDGTLVLHLVDDEGRPRGPGGADSPSDAAHQLSADGTSCSSSKRVRTAPFVQTGRAARRGVLACALKLRDGRGTARATSQHYPSAISMTRP